MLGRLAFALLRHVCWQLGFGQKQQRKVSPATITIFSCQPEKKTTTRR